MAYGTKLTSTNKSLLERKLIFKKEKHEVFFSEDESILAVKKFHNSQRFFFLPPNFPVNNFYSAKKQSFKLALITVAAWFVTK